MRITYRFLSEEDQKVLISLNGEEKSLYAPQFALQLGDEIEKLIGRRLSLEEDSWVWDLNTEEQSREF